MADRSVPVIADFRKAVGDITALLSHAAPLVAPIQPCIRDIHREHILFDGNRVTGLIDFGAMGHDCRAGDVARLIGSLVGDDNRLWDDGLAAYGRVFPLDKSESKLVRVYDACGVLLSGINWLKWIFLEGRQFDDSSAVCLRFEEIAARLAVLANRGASVIV